MTEVAATVTPCTAQQVVNALCAIWPSELGGTSPTLETACVLAAQFALETANGTKCVCHNIGNFKYGGSGNFCQYMTTEYVNGVEQKMTQSFQAFASLEDGVRVWLRSIYTHWLLAWAAACSGDPDGFAEGLHNQHPPYYTAPVAEYVAGMRRYFEPFMKSIVLPPSTTPPDPLADTNPSIIPDKPETD